MASPFVTDPRTGYLTALNITSSTVLSAGPAFIAKISVSVAGAAGTVNDVATTGAVAAANQIGVIPAAVGVYQYEFPCFVGLVVAPGAAQVVSVTYSK